jgi:hypothetical protein
LKRTLILANVLMLALIGITVRAITQRRQAAKTHEQQFLSKKPVVSPVVMVLPKPAPPVAPQAYVAETVGRFLFSRDRNPNVIVKTVAPPEPPMPPLPVAYGLMMWGDPTLFLSEKPGADQRAYHSGDQVGPFKLIAFNDQTVTLGWNGKTIDKSLEDLVNNQSIAAASPAAALQGGVAAPAIMPKTTALVQTAPKQGEPGQKINETMRACLDGDQSPAGSVSSDGYTKVLRSSPFGEMCNWVKQ